ncbi:MAG: hypothetical protein ACRCYR_02120 [Phycicoccus sp.]
MTDDQRSAAAAEHGDRDTEAERGQFMSALVTEHFVLQSMRGTITGEAASRVSVYLASLSSGLVALGFASAGGMPLAWFATPLLLTLFLLGQVTVLRLVEIGIEDVVHLRDMLRVRAVYADFGPSAARFFGSDEDEWDGVGRTMVRRRRGQVWLTMASLVSVVNGALAGTGLAAGVQAATGRSGPAVVLGVLVSVGVAVGNVVWQRRQYRAHWGPGT